MTQPLAEEETDAAAKALIAWFHSQGISPGDAGIVMSKVIADCFVQKSRNPVDLQHAINVFKACVTFDVALYLRQESDR